MVFFAEHFPFPQRILSVLALSSRFDGPLQAGLSVPTTAAFSTRSVESF